MSKYTRTVFESSRGCEKLQITEVFDRKKINL
jgi:hypothetical protein